jgi:hypothetical protein
LINFLYYIGGRKVNNEKELVQEFIKLSMIASSNELLRENIGTEHLMEMSKLQKHETGLPVDIWVDEGKTFSKSGHARRIKFQGDKSNSNTRNWVPLTIDKDPQIPQNIQHNLNTQEINKIKLFVVQNLEPLQMLGNEGYGLSDFFKKMQKV